MKCAPALAALFLFIFFAPALADSAARVPGAYVSSSQHPRVFVSQSDLSDFVTRINRQDSFSSQKFARLSSLVKADVSNNVMWDAAYSGCDIDIYLYTFSIEETRGYASDVRSEDTIRSEMGLPVASKPPAGAAMVASRLALYAALVKAGARASTGAPTPDQAAALAKRILMACAGHGFRDQNGNYLRFTRQFCDQNKAVTPAVQSAVGLQISRGVVYSVNAQELLQSLADLSPAEEKQLNAFHANMYELIRDGLNSHFDLIKMPCDRYSNHVGSQLVGLLATARLLDHRQKFLAALYGDDPSIHVELPWTTYFSKAIYGEAQDPNQCSANIGADGSTSSPSYQTSATAPGEIEDRYRNANPLQAIGHSMGTLEYLYTAADIMKSAGLDAYSYRGTHKQSIENATEYYACYARTVGFKKTVTAYQAAGCADFQQYVGKIVNDEEPSILMGTSRFPGNKAITALDQRAKEESLSDKSIDTIRFGRWTN